MGMGRNGRETEGREMGKGGRKSKWEWQE